MSERRNYSKKERESMSLPELYATGMTTPSFEKRIKLLEDFTKVSPNYCEAFCKLPEKDKCYGDADLRVRNRDRVDVLVLLPSHRPNERTKYGKQVYGMYSDRDHLKIVDLFTKEYLRDFNVEVQYLLKCRPSSTTKLTATTYKKCAPYTESIIRRVKPRVILCLGKEAAQGLSLTPKRGLISYLDIEEGVKIPVLTTLHPRITMMIRQNSSGDFWGPDYLDIIRRDFIKINQILTGKAKLRNLEDVIEDFVRNRLYIARNLQDVYKMASLIKAMPKTNILSYDTETNTLDAWEEGAKFLSNQFTFRPEGCNDTITWVVPLWHRENLQIDADKAYAIIKGILEDESIAKIGHNLSFDFIFNKVVYGVEIKNVAFDTMLLLHSINSGLQGFYDLKTSTADLLFPLQLGGYDDILDLKLLKRRAEMEYKKQMKAYVEYIGSVDVLEDSQPSIASDSEEENDQATDIVVSDVRVF